LGEDWRSGLDFATVAAPLLVALLCRASNSADKRFIKDSAILALQRCAIAQPCVEVLFFVLKQARGYIRNFAAALVIAELADA